MKLTNSSIKRLGKILKEDKDTEEDRKLLDDYRASFDKPFETFSLELENELKKSKIKYHLTERKTKTIVSIRDKLKRSSTSLSRMQDIKGCRIVVTDIINQEKLKNIIERSNLNCSIKYIHREKTGYRSIHVIVTQEDKLIELQLRSKLQDLWANICEICATKQNKKIKLSMKDEDAKNILQLKYGMTDEVIKKTLIKWSNLIYEVENKRYNTLFKKKSFWFFLNKENKSFRHYHTIEKNWCKKLSFILSKLKEA